MEARAERWSIRSVGAAAGICAALLGAATAQVTQRVSLDSSGAQGNGGSAGWWISADGRCVVFLSDATNLVSGDTNGVQDVFLRDRQSGTTERVSLNSSGVQGNSSSSWPSMSGDCRFVVFVSQADNIVSGDTNGVQDVFVRDRQSGTSELVSLDSSGSQGNSDCYGSSISADGRYVAFWSLATNLVSGDTNGVDDIFVRDRQSGMTERVSLDSTGAQGNSGSYQPSISADGRFVAFESFASSLVSGDTNGTFDVFVRDRQSGTTERVSLDSSGAQGNSASYRPSISADGRFVAFESFASNLVSGDTNGVMDAFVRDRQSGTTQRVSLHSSGAQANFGCTEPSISANGRFVAFNSLASTLVSGDTNGTRDVFMHDLQSGATERVSLDSSGAQGNDGSGGSSISADGRYVFFSSYATNLASGDTNAVIDVFVRDRIASGFVSTCDPGSSGVSACPCSNQPSGSGRGCDNSLATGGAVLSASGLAYLASDSLVFTTSGERPTATSVVMQGSAELPAGIAFGQGVRCAGGSLRRMYAKTAAGGAISAPDFGAGDPSISARSASLGDPIQAGQARWYLVYYRDPIVLGGCPATSTFNATQGGRVDWSP